MTPEERNECGGTGRRMAPTDKRSPMLTVKLANLLAKTVRKSPLSIAMCAEKCGVNRNLFYSWVDRGRKKLAEETKGTLHVEAYLAQEVDRALAERAEERLLEGYAANPREYSHNFSQWSLEKTMPRDFGWAQRKDIEREAAKQDKAEGVEKLVLIGSFAGKSVEELAALAAGDE